MHINNVNTNAANFYTRKTYRVSEVIPVRYSIAWPVIGSNELLMYQTYKQTNIE